MSVCPFPSVLERSLSILRRKQLHVRRAGILASRGSLRSYASRILQVRTTCVNVRDQLLIIICLNASPSMEGTLLDQRVFESLVAKCLPGIYEHFQSVDVQISVASLPYVPCHPDGVSIRVS